MSNPPPSRPSPWHRFQFTLRVLRHPLYAVGTCLLLTANQVSAQAGDPTKMLDAWLEKQAQVKSWSADVVQSRKLQALVHALESRGRVWFVQPNRFRWQLGDPPRTIAVRTEHELVVSYPRLKQLERYPLNDAIDPSWRQALALLEVGFPSDPERFHAAYELLSAIAMDQVWQFELRPSAEAALRLIERVRIEVSSEDFTLLTTELQFPDGSTMRNTFTRHELNIDLDKALFDIDVGEDVQVVSPLEGRM